MNGNQFGEQLKKPTGREPLSSGEIEAIADFAAVVQSLFNQIEKYERALEGEYQIMYEEWMRAKHSLALLNHCHAEPDPAIISAPMRKDKGSKDKQ